MTQNPFLAIIFYDKSIIFNNVVYVLTFFRENFDVYYYYNSYFQSNNGLNTYLHRKALKRYTEVNKNGN